MEAMPNFQQDALRIFPPLTIPKPQLFNSLSGKPLLTLLVMHFLLRRAMLKAIQLNREPRQRAVKVQEIIPGVMLTAEFEARKSSGAQSAPELFFLIGLLAAQPAGIVFGIHWRTVTRPGWRINQSINPSLQLNGFPSPPRVGCPAYNARFAQCGPRSFLAGRERPEHVGSHLALELAMRLFSLAP
jgi:hypothetical protein